MTSETSADDADGDAALVRVSYEPATDAVRRELDSSRYRAYLRTVERGPVAPGDTWDHFVSRGCGSTRDVVLTVEAVTGGNRVGDATDFEFVPRDAAVDESGDDESDDARDE